MTEIARADNPDRHPAARAPEALIEQQRLSALQPPARFPVLNAAARQQAEQLSRELDPNKPDQVESFGRPQEAALAGFAHTFVSLMTMGTRQDPRSLLAELQPHLQMLDGICSGAPHGVGGRIRSWLGRPAGGKQQAQAFLACYEKMLPVIVRIEQQLEQGRLSALRAVVVMNQLAADNRAQHEALAIVAAAGIMARDRYAELCSAAQSDDGPVPTLESRQQRRQLEIIEKRASSLQTALAGCETQAALIEGVQKLVIAAADALSEAKHQILPAWKRRMTAVAALLRAKKRFGDERPQSSAGAPADFEAALARMQQGGAFDPKLIAQLNKQLSSDMERMIRAQLAAQQASAEAEAGLAKSAACAPARPA